MGARGWDGEHQPMLPAGELPATLMDLPVVAVTEQDQVLRLGLLADPRTFRLGLSTSVPRRAPALLVTPILAAPDSNNASVIVDQRGRQPCGTAR